MAKAQESTVGTDTTKETEKLVAGKGTENAVVHLFKDIERYKDDVVVGLNGRLYQIQRGIDVEVPAGVAEILNNSIKQDTDTANYLAGLEKTFESRTKEMEG